MKETLQQLHSEIAPFGARLVAVSKTRTVEEILLAVEAGQLLFGENYVQELVEKHSRLPNHLEWHFIGHLQTNKVKQIAPFVSCIHTVDSEKLLKEIDKEAAKWDRRVDCLLQVHIAQEETKYGLTYQEAERLLSWHSSSGLSHTCITGLMGMATNTEDAVLVDSEFRGLHEFFLRMKLSHPALHELSMGMTGDYRIALKNGSTLIRIGSAIFGQRHYTTTL
jgi:pyridoxal phosphate enzyme (YggS family)